MLMTACGSTYVDSEPDYEPQADTSDTVDDSTDTVDDSTSINGSPYTEDEVFINSRKMHRLL